MYEDQNLRKLFEPKIKNQKDIDELLAMKNETKRKEMFELRIK